MQVFQNNSAYFVTYSWNELQKQFWIIQESNSVMVLILKYELLFLDQILYIIISIICSKFMIFFLQIKQFIYLQDLDRVEIRCS